MTSDTEFERQAEPFRRELLAHCYRMMGSVQDAEDLVQETLLRAWRAYGRFDDQRASLRTWLHQIATNACLNALDRKRRRPLPSGLAGSSDDPTRPLVRGDVGGWLQPFPDALLAGADEDPAAALASRESLRLALVAAWQLLPPRQRAIVILRDVLDYSAVEAAAMLETTPPAVNSALQRARARLRAVAIEEEQLAGPDDPHARALIERYVEALTQGDIAALQELLTADAIVEMPPMLSWFVGREAYGSVIAQVIGLRGRDWRMLPTAANGQPALAAYARGEDGGYHANSVQVFSVTGRGISRNVVFLDPGLFPLFGLPVRLDDATG